ncbi:cytochrome P450 family protein [Rhizoctonia solani AG-3 Rhs1AP]|uniref:Cytochrome P450 family protein n=2 Tax=Rhizoctonia solani AG-3 TaxID=1086053 RepID=A0A074RH48_9AGAM|nr:cytochrome P450 family protein [Rhizoctonia solani AG-3 Rhs1AP]KEP46104.1 cytochrome P450 family protein [Rhizoctonia solani 123E]
MLSANAVVINGTFYASLCLLALVFLQKCWYSVRNGHRRHPPSPWSLPVVGNLFSIPPDMDHIAYVKLGKQLNTDMISLRLFGYNFLVLNSARVATEILDKRSGIYSDRLSTPMIKDPSLLDWGDNAVLLGYGDLWRHYRRMMNNWLNARAVTQFDDIQEQRIQPLLHRLVQLQYDSNPFDKVKRAFFYNAADSMLKLGYGYTLQGDDDIVFQDMQHTNDHTVRAGMFTNFFVNIFPSLTYVPDWFPGTDWKRTAREWRALKERSQSVPYEWTKTQLASGTAEPSILGALLQNHKLVAHLSEQEKERRLKEVPWMIVAAGTDTTSTALVAFVAAMVLNPHAQAKAQKELDDILGPTTLPTMADRKRLPYIQNLIQEVLRWQPVNPTGIAHACWQDDSYEGYDIKKGTVVIGNLWAISHDGNVYKDPEIFNPDRFQDPSVPYAPAFGWGRRKCPGIYFAEASLFIVVASLLATFTFLKKRDAAGQEIEPKIEPVSNAIIMELKPFDFELKLRSAGHRQLIRE